MSKQLLKRASLAIHSWSIGYEHKWWLLWQQLRCTDPNSLELHATVGTMALSWLAFQGWKQATSPLDVPFLCLQRLTDAVQGIQYSRRSHSTFRSPRQGHLLAKLTPRSHQQHMQCIFRATGLPQITSP
jgi:hypothetical protein